MSDVRIKISSLEKEFDSLNSVFKSGKVKSGDTVYILTDVEIETPVVIDKSCSIDLGGHFIFVPMSGGLTVKGGASVSFENGSIQTLSDAQLDAQISDAIISQGSRTVVTLKDTLHVETSGTAIHARKRGKFVVDGATIETIGDQSAICVDDSGSSLVVNDGVVTSFTNSAISVRDGGSVEINGGTIHTEVHSSIPKDLKSAIIISGDQSKATVTGGSIFSYDTVAIQEQSGASVEMQGGEVFTKNNMWPTVELNEGNTFFKMSGGHVYSTDSHAFLANKTEVGSVQGIEITGGKVGAYGDIVITAGKGDHGVVFSGGAVKGDLSKEFIAEGYVVSDIKDDEGYANIILKTWTDDEDNETEPFTNVDPVEDKPTVLPEAPDSRLLADLPDAVDLPEIIPTNISSQLKANNEVVSPDDLPTDVFNPSNTTSAPVPEAPSSVTTTPVVTNTKPESEDVVLAGTSVNIKHRTYIYRNPSRKSIIAEWRGALSIIECGNISTDGEEFALVRFKLPGSGRKAIGYVPMVDILNP